MSSLRVVPFFSSRLPRSSLLRVRRGSVSPDRVRGMRPPWAALDAVLGADESSASNPKKSLDRFPPACVGAGSGVRKSNRSMEGGGAEAGALAICGLARVDDDDVFPEEDVPPWRRRDEELRPVAPPPLPSFESSEAVEWDLVRRRLRSCIR